MNTNKVVGAGILISLFFGILGSAFEAITTGAGSAFFVLGGIGFPVFAIWAAVILLTSEK